MFWKPILAKPKFWKYPLLYYLWSLATLAWHPVGFLVNEWIKKVAPCTLQLVPCALHIAPCTLHLVPCSLCRLMWSPRDEPHRDGPTKLPVKEWIKSESTQVLWEEWYDHHKMSYIATQDFLSEERCIHLSEMCKISNTLIKLLYSRATQCPLMRLWSCPAPCCDPRKGVQKKVALGPPT